MCIQTGRSPKKRRVPGFRRAMRHRGGRELSENKQDWSIVIRPRTKWYDIDFKEFWKYRDLIGLFVKRDFVVKYKQTVLGPAWALIQPLLTTIIFTFIFGTVAQLDTDGVPEFLFYMCGNIVWHYFSTCLTGNSNTFVENVKVFTKIYFPRLLVPASTVITNFVTYMIQFVLFLGFLAFYICFKGFAPAFQWGYVLPGHFAGGHAWHGLRHGALVHDDEISRPAHAGGVRRAALDVCDASGVFFFDPDRQILLGVHAQPHDSGDRAVPRSLFGHE